MKNSRRFPAIKVQLLVTEKMLEGEDAHTVKVLAEHGNDPSVIAAMLKVSEADVKLTLGLEAEPAAEPPPPAPGGTSSDRRDERGHGANGGNGDNGSDVCEALERDGAFGSFEEPSFANNADDVDVHEIVSSFLAAHPALAAATMDGGGLYEHLVELGSLFRPPALK